MPLPISIRVIMNSYLSVPTLLTLATGVTAVTIGDAGGSLVRDLQSGRSYEMIQSYQPLTLVTDNVSMPTSAPKRQQMESFACKEDS